MATKFLEPGGDIDFTAAGGVNGFWQTNSGVTVVSDFVHGGHVKSLKVPSGTFNSIDSPTNSIADAGTRISFYVYFTALPSAATKQNFALFKTSVINSFSISITDTGVLQLWNGYNSNQIGSNGSTLSTGVWYRISLAYTITSSSVNRFELFVNGVSSISITNTTITTTGATFVRFGNNTVNTTDFRLSDIYTDDSSSLVDTGDMWVTAKRPNANGTTNGFTTQIGAGGSGYGTGHSSQVNERPLSTTNGWSIVGSGSAVTEEYNIESKSAGDIDISTKTIIDWIGWVSVNSLVGETINIIIDGANVSQATNNTITIYQKVKGSASYPSGSGADIGIQTDTTVTTVNLYECGILVAFTSVTPVVSSGASFLFKMI